ncbi:MAG: hypothetical protein V1702_00810 [Candidatus Woesearchaeota archaeon]
MEDFDNMEDIKDEKKPVFNSGLACAERVSNIISALNMAKLQGNPRVTPRLLYSFFTEIYPFMTIEQLKAGEPLLLAVFGDFQSIDSLSILYPKPANIPLPGDWLTPIEQLYLIPTDRRQAIRQLELFLRKTAQEVGLLMPLKGENSNSLMD